MVQLSVSGRNHAPFEVKKMITVYGAPASEADAKAIVEYLATAYGPAKTKPAKEKKAGK